MLPNVEAAYIADQKTTHYLLSPTSTNGKHKAKLFRSFGFDLAQWQLLRDALLAHAAANEAIPSDITPYGPTFDVIGPLPAPDGRTPYVRVVWIIRNGEDFARLVTVLPSEPSKP